MKGMTRESMVHRVVRMKTDRKLVWFDDRIGAVSLIDLCDHSLLH